MLPIDKPLVRELNIVYHRRKFLTRNMQDFIALCREPLERRKSLGTPSGAGGKSMKQYNVMLKPASSLCNLGADTAFTAMWQICARCARSAS